MKQFSFNGYNQATLTYTSLLEKKRKMYVVNIIYTKNIN